MKKHSQIGYEILKGSKSKYLKAGGVIAYNHHEKYDGSGYPQKLVGENIVLEARILAVADAYDALVSKRIYRSALPQEHVFEILVRDAGNHFDPTIVEQFQQLQQVSGQKTENR